MKKLETICIMCPIGCHLKIVEENGNVVVSGNTCPRGETYGKQELINPMRIITSVVKGKDAVYNVKTSCAVPKDLIFNCLKVLKKLRPDNFEVGDLLVKNILNTSADIIITCKTSY